MIIDRITVTQKYPLAFATSALLKNKSAGAITIDNIIPIIEEFISLYKLVSKYREVKINILEMSLYKKDNIKST